MADPVSGVAFPGAHLEIDGEVVAKVTSYSKSTSIEETEVTGSEDTVGTAPEKVAQQKFKPVAVGKTASIEGVYVTDDQGQSDLEDAANSGLTVQLRFQKQDGKGNLDTGHFTSFDEEGALGNVFTFSGEFRVNDREDIDQDPS